MSESVGATATVVVDGVPLTVAFRVLDDPVLAGGPVAAQLEVENPGAIAVPIPVGTDRARRRPRHVSLTGSIEEVAVDLVDPWSGLPDRGGIAGELDLGPGEPLTQSILLNDFLTLEDVLPAMVPGQRATLRVRCVRRMTPPAGSADGSPHDATIVEMRVELPIVRDDDRLATIGDELLDQLRTAPPATVEARERQINRLAALPPAFAERSLRTLAEAGDSHLAGLATDALARLDLRNRCRTQRHAAPPDR